MAKTLSETAEPAGRQTIAGVERALDVLSVFAAADSPDLGVTEIAGQLGMSKAVVHRILSSCRVKDYLSFDPSSRRYRLGPGSVRLGLSYLSHLDLMAEVRQALHRLTEVTEETSTHTVRAGWDRVYVDQVTPPRDIKMTVCIGASYPMHAGASGKALLAFQAPDVREAYFIGQDLRAVTSATVTSPGRLKAELEEIRERGFATSVGERLEGSASVAAPVLDRLGHAVATVSVCGPVERFSAVVDACADEVLRETGHLSAALGWVKR